MINHLTTEVSLFLSPGLVAPVDWPSLRRPSSPNTYLMAPPGFTSAAADATAPSFNMPIETLMQRWDAMIARQPRVAKKAKTDDGLQIDYVQRTLFMRFPDWITVRFIPAGRDRATLAIYSRSVYGYSDLGVNKARVQSWVAGLQDESASG